MKLKITQEKKLGLEIYAIYLNGTLVHTYLCKEIAMTAYLRLKKKFVDEAKDFH